MPQEMSSVFGVKPGSMIRNLEVHVFNTMEAMILRVAFVPVLKYDLKINEC